MNTVLFINPQQEVKVIKSFIKKVLAEQGFKKVVIGLSGGTDSVTSLSLLARSIPVKNIIAVYLPYFETVDKHIDNIIKSTGIPRENFHVISIKPIVDVCISTLGVERDKKVRIGNIAARARMITLYDVAKKENALVCGTENKSEYRLGYFTRYGDEASDIEPIRHLYKTQVYELAKYLGVPQEVIDKPATAGLWQDQTDEGELGFTYQEADQVLFHYFEQKLSVEEIEKKGLTNAKKIIEWTKINDFKHHVPYLLKSQE